MCTCSVHAASSLCLCIQAFSSLPAPLDTSASTLLYAWGQFIISHISQSRKAHDEQIGLAFPTRHSPSYAANCSSFSGTSFFRSAYTVIEGIRHPINRKSVFIDGSSLYGENEKERRTVREGKGGRVRLDSSGLPEGEGKEKDECRHFAFADPLLNLHPLLSVFAIGEYTHVVHVDMHTRTY